MKKSEFDKLPKFAGYRPVNEREAKDFYSAPDKSYVPPGNWHNQSRQYVSPLGGLMKEPKNK
jgi:hypothetical protein